MNQEDLRYLEALSYRFPSIPKASTEIINLSSILNLPKGTEHFISDVHGEYEQFAHILKNGSGNVRAKIELEFGFELSKEDKTELATLIYYPNEKMKLVEAAGTDMIEWYRMNLLRLIRVARRVSVKYTRSKVRKAIPQDFRYVIEELLTDNDVQDKVSYYDGILQAIISTGQAKACICAFSYMISRLTVDHLHLIGDIYDRGPGPHLIMDTLVNYHSVDIQWGNHDLIWLGAACGNPLCVATALRLSARYDNLDIMENGYGINLIPLMRLAVDEYGSTDTHMFAVKYVNDHNPEDEIQDARMHKAAAILQFKLEGQWVKAHPEYPEMQDRLLLDKIDYENKTVNVMGKLYPIEDTDFPTVDPKDPYKLTEREAQVMEQICASFRGSEKLQRHMRFMLNKGSLYLVYNGNLLYHGCIPVNEDGSFHEMELLGKTYSGRSLLDELDSLVRKAYFGDPGEEKDFALDLLYYLWCGKWSPLFGKERMTTFERQLIKDTATHEEPKIPYYLLQDDEKMVRGIFDEFGLDWESGKIISGHVPVRRKKGESPVKCGGKLLIIDGGFARAYQPTTGIAGYTLIYNSQNMKLVAHEPFTSAEDAVKTGRDIHSEATLLELITKRVTVGDTDNGKRLKQSINDLTQLLDAYRKGLIKEKE